MKLLFLIPSPDKDRGTVELVSILSPNGEQDWRTSGDSFYEELRYELERHESQFKETI